MMLGVTGTSPNSVTLTLYPFGRETSMGKGKVLMFLREFLLKIIWFDAPESMIHKLALDSKHLQDELSTIVEEEQITVPVKFIDPVATPEALLAPVSSPTFPFWKCCNRVMICPYCSFVKLHSLSYHLETVIVPLHYQTPYHL